MQKYIKKVLKFIFHRMFIVGILIFLQLFTLVWLIWQLGEYFVYSYIFFITISFFVVLYIINKKGNPSYKLAWIIPILVFPIFGGLFYVLVGGDKASKKFKKECTEIFALKRKGLEQDKKVYKEIYEKNKAVALQSKYIAEYAGYPAYINTKTKYLSPGENFFEELVKALEKADHYIFMEYFIIEEGEMWNKILDILEKKVKQGLDVRLIYDDAGTIQTLPYKYHEKLKKLGIKVGVFNEIRARLTLKINNRDHRKITVIDGYIGFTGGINIADEYINVINKFGHWKDSAIMLEGEAVQNLTIMFLQMWEYVTKEKIDEKLYSPYKHYKGTFESDGYVQPYSDSPLDEETVGENVYLNIIHKAKDYVYINTPYLIIDNELMVALSLAAKSGVDVRIITPHKEDKWYVHILTRAYYAQLIESGVKIYEYKPGFIHAKSFVSDDEVAVVGTVNLDYRSLYLHFECGVWLYKTKSIYTIKKDFVKTLEMCIPITMEECYKVRWYVKFVRSLIRVFAPLM